MAATDDGRISVTCELRPEHGWSGTFYTPRGLQWIGSCLGCAATVEGPYTLETEQSRTRHGKRYRVLPYFVVTPQPASEAL